MGTCGANRQASEINLGLQVTINDLQAAGHEQGVLVMGDGGWRSQGCEPGHDLRAASGEQRAADRKICDKAFSVTTASGIKLTLKAFWAGADLVLIMAGGDAPHIGAVAVAVPRPSLDDPLVTSSTTSIIALTGHKDDELAKPLAAEGARRLGRPVVAVVGVHIENATALQIAEVAEAAARLGRKAITALAE